MSPMEISRLLKLKAQELGFLACGIATAFPLQHIKAFLSHSVALNYHDGKKYLEDVGTRINPTHLLPDVKSVIVFAMGYYSDSQTQGIKISRYAYGKDYHKVIEAKLQKIVIWLETVMPGIATRITVDAGPIVEKAWAQLAGLGCIGKNTLLINPKWGSFSFLSTILINKELSYDSPFQDDLCKNCSKCIKNCPTAALVAPYQLDARRCIANITIESKSAQLSELHGFKESKYVYGCDMCQLVCPHNIAIQTTTEPDFLMKPALAEMTEEDWKNLSEEKFQQLFADSAIKRTGYQRFMRNIRFVLEEK